MASANPFARHGLSFGQATALSPAGSHPENFKLANVLVGAKRISTLSFEATGKWWPDYESGDSSLVGLLSAKIRCLKDLAFCERVGALVSVGPPTTLVVLEDFDILRWNEHEIIAVDSEPFALITMRVDFQAQSVSLDRTPTAEGAAEGDKPETAFLQGQKEEIERVQKKASELAAQERAKKK